MHPQFDPCFSTRHICHFRTFIDSRI